MRGNTKDKKITINLYKLVFLTFYFAYIMNYEKVNIVTFK